MRVDPYMIVSARAPETDTRSVRPIYSARIPCGEPRSPTRRGNTRVIVARTGVCGTEALVVLEALHVRGVVGRGGAERRAGDAEFQIVV